MRDRATRAEMQHRHDVLFEICQRDQPLTIRNAYYQAQTTGIVTKGDNEYGKVQRAILDMRRSRRLPYGWIVDMSRSKREPHCVSGLDEAFDDLQRHHIRDLWSTSDKRVELWCESDSIAGVVLGPAWRWTVSVFPCKGQPSESFVYEAGVNTAADGRPLTVLYLGDLDPAGLEINKETHRKLRSFAPGVDIEWRRIGVTIEQVEELGLIGLGNKPKKRVDWFPFDETFECESIPAPQLRGMVEESILGHLDPSEVEAVKAAQETERQTLDLLASKWRSDPGSVLAFLEGSAA